MCITSINFIFTDDVLMVASIILSYYAVAHEMCSNASSNVQYDIKYMCSYAKATPFARIHNLAFSVLLLTFDSTHSA